MNHELAISLRQKKLGILIRDARLAAGKSMKECGQVIGVSGGTIGSFERGVKSPSLPELELLAYSLNASIDHFWSEDIKSNDQLPGTQLDTERTLILRHRVIGALLRQARVEADLTMKDLGQQVGITTGMLRKYELGERPIPLPELEALANALGLDVHSFSDHQSRVGKWIFEQRVTKSFLELPSELQEFVSRPTNRPYLELAQRLSDMSAEKLRQVAESLLDISL